MNQIVESIKAELIERCNNYKLKYGFDYWNDHIKYVVKNAVQLANKYNADVEIVELGALLHDIAMPSEFGPKEEHNVYGVEIAEELLSKLNYSEDRKQRVKECVLRHRGSKDLPRNTIEEQCVADADVMAHFDAIPSLFHLAFGGDEKNMTLEDGTEFVRKKLERDFNKLSDKTREDLRERYENIVKILFVEK